MTTLYRPVEIISAEQAEALPVGTPFLTFRTDPGKDPLVVEADFVDGINDYDLTPGWNWHCVALVPIEAKEVRVVASGGLERDQHGATVINHTPDGPRRDYRRTEFHTPWEVAP